MGGGWLGFCIPDIKMKLLSSENKNGSAVKPMQSHAIKTLPTCQHFNKTKSLCQPNKKALVEKKERKCCKELHKN